MTKKNSKGLIITVDDFGYDQEANQLIFEAINKRVLNHVSTMVNMEGTDQALRYIKQLKSQIPKSKFQTNIKYQISNIKIINQTRFGLHLNLTEGKPLSGRQQVPSLLNKDGNFIGWQKLIFRLATGHLRPHDVERETRAQIEKMQTVIKPTPFLNSHHHIHLWPPIAKVIIPLCQEYGIKRLRWPRKLWWPSITSRHGMKALTIQLLPKLSSIDDRLSANDYFFDLDWTNINSLDKLLSNLPQDIEVSCHPPTLFKLSKLIIKGDNPTSDNSSI
jgi:predicted glycoside hydrolase/deacetylase ChbG (UPF0249 family)